MSDFQIGPETFVVVSVQARDAEGEIVGEPEIVGFVFGFGQLFPRVERELDGRRAGDELSVQLAPREAFGRRKPEAILTVDRSDFPPDVAPGDRFEVENAEGGLLVIQILEVDEEVVVIDTNHPLADQTITLDIRVLEVRLASPEELRGAEEEALEAENASTTRENAAPPGEEDDNRPDVSVGSLLRGRTRS